MTNLVVRVALPDRPGALGQVAARIGALGADIVGIDVLERTKRLAVDEFSVRLPREDLVTLLVREVEEVDGASVRDWRLVDEFPDPRLDALTSIEHVFAASDPPDVARRLTASVCVEFAADWAALVAGTTILGATHSNVDADIAKSDDVAVSLAPVRGARLLVVRKGRPFLGRERAQLDALARIADRLLELMR